VFFVIDLRPVNDGENIGQVGVNIVGRSVTNVGHIGESIGCTGELFTCKLAQRLDEGLRCDPIVGEKPPGRLRHGERLLDVRRHSNASRVRLRMLHMSHNQPNITAFQPCIRQFNLKSILLTLP